MWVHVPTGKAKPWQHRIGERYSALLSGKVAWVKASRPRKPRRVGVLEKAGMHIEDGDNLHPALREPGVER
mgnify:CR=1 FL=1